MTPTTTSANICDRLDGFEGINAAEWDEVPESQSLAEQQEFTPTRRLEFSKIENRKVDGPANTVVSALPTRPRAAELFKPVKTTTCWFWATPNKACRFTAEECRYLHAFLPTRLGELASKSSWSTPVHSQPPPSMSHPHLDSISGKLIKVINVSDLPNLETSPKIERCEYLASYNWLDYPKYPTILVPGAPPLWSPSPNRKRLKEDSGEYFRDPNAARYPRCPTEPAFRALLAMHPDFNPLLLDVVGCGSTLGNLLCFCAGIGKDFRFDVDRVGDTVFFVRKESYPTAIIHDIRGYGHSFPEAHTIWEPDVQGSTSHQRIIQYDFGGLKFLVRSESDGYLKQAVDRGTQCNDAKDLPESMENLVKTQAKVEADTLLEALRITKAPSSTFGPLHIERRGRQILQKAIFDLKTRAKETSRPIDMDEVYRRLWVNQTPYFIFAEHFRGSFEPRDIQPVSISDRISNWEKDRESLLRHYQAVVMEIIAATRSSFTGKLQVIRRGSGPLEIQERVARDDADVLPHDLRSKW